MLVHVLAVSAALRIARQSADMLCGQPTCVRSAMAAFVDSSVSCMSLFIVCMFAAWRCRIHSLCLQWLVPVPCDDCTLQSMHAQLHPVQHGAGGWPLRGPPPGQRPSCLGRVVVAPCKVLDQEVASAIETALGCGASVYTYVQGQQPACSVMIAVTVWEA